MFNIYHHELYFEFQNYRINFVFSKQYFLIQSRTILTMFVLKKKVPFVIAHNFVRDN